MPCVSVENMLGRDTRSFVKSYCSPRRHTDHHHCVRLAFHHCNERLQGSAFKKGKVLFWLEVLKFFAHDRGAYGRRVDHPEDMWQRELHLRLGTKERGGECLPQSTQGGAIPKDLRPPIRPHLLKSTLPSNSIKLRTKPLTCRSLDDVPDYSNNQNSLPGYLSGQLSPALHHQ